MGFLDDKDPKLRLAAVQALGMLGVGPAEARRIGQAFLDKALPQEARMSVLGVLVRHADKDAECARLLEAIKKAGE